MTSLIKNKRGIVEIDKGLLISFDRIELKVFYSNFYPIAMEIIPNFNYDKIRLYMCSDYFREIKEGEKIPKYEVFFKRIENKKSYKIIIDKVVEINI